MKIVEAAPYWRVDLSLAAAAFAATGAIALAQTWAKRRSSKAWMPPEPEFSVSMLLIYIGLAYFIGGLVNRVLRSQEPIWSYALVLVTLTAIHLEIILLMRKADRYRESVLRLERDSQAPILATAVNMKSQLGLTDVYDDPESQAFLDALASDLKSAFTLRVLIPNPDYILTGQNALSRMLMSKMQMGFPIEFLSARHPSVPLPITSSIVLTSTARPEMWILDTGSFIYLASGSPNLPWDKWRVLRMDKAASGGGSSLVDAAYATLAGAAEEARAEGKASKVIVSRGPGDYRREIARLESTATEVDRIAKRIFVVFKDDATVRTIAEQRYGVGSAYLSGYVDEHRERRQIFFSALRGGLRCREIYSAEELRNYVRGRSHGVSAVLGTENVQALLANWKHAILTLENYHVAVSEEPLPFKYEIIDRSAVVLHEAIGVNEAARVNAMFIEGAAAADYFQAEFDMLWDRIPPGMRSPSKLAEWIESELEPMLE
jgi:hypothetical protein